MGDFKGTMAFGCKFPRWVMEVEMSCLEPNLIFYFSRGKLASGPRGHDLSGGFISSKGFLMSFVKD